MKLVSVAAMRDIETQADAAGLTYQQMMENAGRNLAKVIGQLVLSEGEEIHALGLVGPGNNGGDTLVALAHLAAQGWKVGAYLVQREAEGDSLVRRLREAGGEVMSNQEDAHCVRLQAEIASVDVVLDGLLGTGFKPPLKEEMRLVMVAAKSALEAREWSPLVIAVDCPSGVNCDTGEAEPECFPAGLTITMAAMKRGLLKLPAYDLAGDIHLVDIGPLDLLPAWQAVRDEVMEADMVAAILPPRPSEAHKGTFGTAVVVAGSVNYTGAALLAGKAAYRVGAGLVTMAIPLPLHAALAGQFAEATWLLLPHELGVISVDAAEVLTQNLERATALLIGPGFGLEETTAEFLERLLRGEAVKPGRGRIGFVRLEAEKEGKPFSLPPLVVDADGLKLLTRISNWPRLLPPQTILTPHPGEMAVLTGQTVTEIQQNRPEIARHFASEWGQVVVLKGAFTVVAAPDGRTTTIPIATPALARAGTGDVLAGLIVGLRAQGVEAYEAARAAAWLHAQAGLRAAEQVGNVASVMAGDVLESVAEVLTGLLAPASPL